MNKKEIKVGDKVFVNQDEGIVRAVVVELFPDNPTTNEKGFWVDVDAGKGVEGIMSYILQVI